MLQSIQFNGSGPPTYVYSKNAVGATMDFYQVLAAETKSYQEKREYENWSVYHARRKMVNNRFEFENEEMVNVDDKKTDDLQMVYQKEFGRRESFLWKQR